MSTELDGQSQEEGGITLQIQVMGRRGNQGVSYSQLPGKGDGFTSPLLPKAEDSLAWVYSSM